MNALKMAIKDDTLIITRLDRKAIGFNTLADLVETAAKEVLTYQPEIGELLEDLIVDCASNEDAALLSKEIKETDAEYFDLAANEPIDAPIIETGTRTEQSPDQEPEEIKEELPK